MKLGSLFSGYGGLDMASAAVLGTTTAWHCEVDPAASRILAHRYPDVPNHGDITAINWDQVEPVDVLTGGFPCQDVSAAGQRAGLRPGTRSGLWTHMAHAINQLRPRLVVIENVRGLLSAAAHSDLEPCPWCVGDGEGEPPLRALGAVLGDLADLGYDASWYGVRASDAGAPHARFRVFIAATDTRRGELQRWGGRRELAGATRGHQSEGHQRERHGNTPRDGGAAPTHTDRAGLEERRGLGSDPRQERPATLGSGATPDALRDGREGCQERDRGAEGPEGHDEPQRLHPDRRTLWGEYEPAIRRWEAILGRPAPQPTEPGPRGNPRLSARFVEFMMGLPAGWVTDVPGVKRNEQLKALGNGVVPQQAALALRYLLSSIELSEVPA